MGNLITSLYTGASGIFVSQTAVQVTGNNIANVNTDGYTRQSANITSATPLEDGGLQYGTGSSVDTIDRAENSFVIKQLVDQSATYGEYEASSTPLSNLEEILDISDSSLASDIDSFFDAWEQLSSNPSGSSERQQVIQEAVNLADRFQEINQLLSEEIDDLNTSVAYLVPDLNEQLQQIADLNSSIMQAEMGGTTANTLRDERDLLVQQVSETIGATTYQDENDMVCLQLNNGLPLVTGTVASTLTVSKVDGLMQVEVGSPVSSGYLDSDDVGGTLKGLLEVRDTVIPELTDSIDQLAYELVNAVNTVHTTGVDQNGNAGTDLFTVVAPTNPLAPAWEGASASIEVAFTDSTMLAAGTTGQTGDNSLTLTMVELREQSLVNGSTFTEEYARIASKVGLLVSDNAQKLEVSEERLNEISNNRDSISGVSTDEEMVLLIQYQAGYQAASKYLATIRDMLDVLMQL
ncbi:flagellar hook-associated protein FlgK [Desulfogranum japonicum]|uniref:flagellar hook-associated protein FlgK n=1 Tax=Desulfogranum japonicum TaxID=231447 RepID=UPI00041DD3C8|nr:flagellar hook-associated protein FlgK [Desulfogranum japonicum]